MRVRIDKEEEFDTEESAAYLEHGSIEFAAVSQGTVSSTKRTTTQGTEGEEGHGNDNDDDDDGWGLDKEERRWFFLSQWRMFYDDLSAADQKRLHGWKEQMDELSQYTMGRDKEEGVSCDWALIDVFDNAQSMISLLLKRV